MTAAFINSMVIHLCAPIRSIRNTKATLHLTNAFITSMKYPELSLSFNCTEKSSSFTSDGAKENCASCKEFVHVYTHLSKRELNEVLSRAQGTVCGKIFEDQLDVQAPSSSKWVAAGVTSLLSLTLSVDTSAQTTSPPAIEQTDQSEYLLKFQKGIPFIEYTITVD